MVVPRQADSNKRLTTAYKPAARPVQRQESHPGIQQLSKRQHRANASSALV